MPSLGTDSRLTLRPLVVRAHEDEFLVGDAERGEFAVFPEVGVVIVEAMRAGGTLGEVAEVACGHVGGEVDVLDFAATLIELEFVAQVDDVVLGDGRPRLRDGGRIGVVLAPAAVFAGGVHGMRA